MEVDEGGEALLPPVSLVQSYNRARGLVCIVDNQDFALGDRKFQALKNLKALMGGPALLLVLDDSG